MKNPDKEDETDMSLTNELNDELLKQVSGGTGGSSDDPRFDVLLEMLYNLLDQFDEYEVQITTIIKNVESSRAKGSQYECVRDDTFIQLQQIPSLFLRGKILTKYFSLP